MRLWRVPYSFSLRSLLGFGLVVLLIGILSPLLLLLLLVKLTDLLLSFLIAILRFDLKPFYFLFSAWSACCDAGARP